MAKKRAKSEEPKKTVKSEEPKKKKPISLNILEIAKRIQKLEQTAGMPSEYPASKVMMLDGDSVESKLDDLTAYTVYDNWQRNSSMPSGSTPTTGSWQWILYKKLPAGVYYISGYVNMTSSTSISLLQRLRTGYDNQLVTLSSNSVAATQRLIESAGIFKFDEDTDVYIDVYASNTYSVAAAEAYAIKIG